MTNASRPTREGRPRFTHRRRVCAFCADRNLPIDYKRVEMFGRYLSERGTIEPRKKTGTCARHQRRLAIAIKRARHIALLPFSQQHVRTTGVPVPSRFAGRPPREPYGFRESREAREAREPVREPVEASAAVPPAEALETAVVQETAAVSET